MSEQHEPHRRPRRERPSDQPGTGRIGHGGRARSTDPGRRSAQRPSQRRRSGDPARLVAYETLRAVSDGAYANLDLPKRVTSARLDSRDAAFATEIVYGVTRMRGLYDAIIGRCAGREVGDIDAPVLDVLRMGVHQLLSMRVPAHAAVDATVGLARGEIGVGASSFVNAVLRRISEKPSEEWLTIVADVEGNPGSVDHLATAYSHPAWMVRALRAALLAHGASTPESVDADLIDLLRAHNDPADVTLVARPGLSDLEELMEAGAKLGSLSPCAAVLTDGGDPGRIPAVREGRAGVQDEGSQLIALLLVEAYDQLTARSRITDADPGALTDTVDTQHSPRWLDLCAGPGGKAALLAALAIPRGATLFCNEVAPHRADLVERAVGAAMDSGAEVFVGVGDGRTIGSEEPASFDLVLLDAPCTGLGALRRRPDARWRREPSDVGDLIALQEELLASGLEALAPGGVLGYATCSPHEAETSQVLRRVLAGRDDVELVEPTPLLDAVLPLGAPRPTGRDGRMQWWPHLHGCDAMFFAVLRKTNAQLPVDECGGGR